MAVGLGAGTVLHMSNATANKQARKAAKRRRYRERHPEKVAARRAVYRAMTWEEREQACRAAEAREEQREEAAEQLRQAVAGHLQRKGWVREGGEGGSMYFRRGKQVVRVSDHDVPMTAERIYNVSSGGFSWADTSRSLVIKPGSKPMQALRWVVAVSRA